MEGELVCQHASNWFCDERSQVKGGKRSTVETHVSVFTMLSSVYSTGARKDVS